MLRNKLSVLLLALPLAAASVQAQKFEMVHGLDFESTAGAKAALDTLFADDAMKGAKATLYALDAGDGRSSHLVVEDFNSYADRVKTDKKRLESHGWSKFVLATQDSDYLGSDMVMVVDDHGKPRHTAEYLAAILIHTTDAASYRAAVADLNKALGNPGVLRLVASRTGNRSVTHAVLIGGKDFAAVNSYLDKIYSSKAFEDFVAKVGKTRKVVGVDMYHRVATWGY